MNRVHTNQPSPQNGTNGCQLTLSSLVTAAQQVFDLPKLGGLTLSRYEITLDRLGGSAFAQVDGPVLRVDAASTRLRSGKRSGTLKV